MIKNIIFDIGEILVKENCKEYLINNIEDEERAREIHHEVFTSEAFREFIRGNTTREEMLEKLQELEIKEMDWIKETFKESNFHQLVPLKKEDFLWYQELKKQGYHVYLLSNLTQDTYEFYKKNYSFVQEADGGVFSCFEHMKKPEEEIYQMLLTRYHLKPEESIFIDDKKRNIETAKKMNIHGIVYQSLEQVKQEMNKIIEKNKD